MADTTDLITRLRRLALEAADTEPGREAALLQELADAWSELDLRLARGERLPADWVCERRVGKDRRRRNLILLQPRQPTAADPGAPVDTAVTA